MTGSLIDLTLIAVGGFLAARVTGSAGFAFGIIVTSVWIHVLQPAQIVLLASICATSIHVASVWRFHSEIEFRLLWPFVLGGALGVPLGVMGLTRLDPIVFRRLFGAFMICYSIYLWSRPHFPVVHLAAALRAHRRWRGGMGERGLGRFRRVAWYFAYYLVWAAWLGQAS